MAVTNGPAADATTTMGYGTGHTLGYRGNAPADIKPAYSQPDGFSCFDCHTPHGNSERVLATFFSPGRYVAPEFLLRTQHIRIDYDTLEVAEVVTVDWPMAQRDFIEALPLNPPGYDPTDDWVMVWGIEPPLGNIIAKYDFGLFGFNYGPVTYRKPIFPKGRYLLLKNPDDENGEGVAGDLVTDTVPSGGLDLTTGGSNKIAIDWDNPLGPGVTYQGENSVYYTTNDERFPFPLFFTGTTQDRPGVATVGEFCTDCHDGTVGLAQQAAEVWHSTEETYVVAYSHDAQPRGCDRQMIFNADDEANFGPDCRSCHSGAGSCYQCHEDGDVGTPVVDIPLERVWDSEGYPEFSEGVSPYRGQEALWTTYTRVYVDSPSVACVDGGFSFPHRTLGVNMLKDELWGVDYDGTPVAPGEVRDSRELADLEALWSGTAGVPISASYDVGRIIGQPAHNLDSECIDCHNPNVWSGSPATAFSAPNILYDVGYRVDGANPEWTFEGWELLLKGLP
jgi:hypothetical protein